MDVIKSDIREDWMFQIYNELMRIDKRFISLYLKELLKIENQYVVSMQNFSIIKKKKGSPTIINTEYPPLINVLTWHSLIKKKITHELFKHSSYYKDNNNSCKGLFRLLVNIDELQKTVREKIWKNL